MRTAQGNNALIVKAHSIEDVPGWLGLSGAGQLVYQGWFPEKHMVLTTCPLRCRSTSQSVSYGKLDMHAGIEFVWNIVPTQRDRSMEPADHLYGLCSMVLSQKNTLAFYFYIVIYACCCDHDFGSAHPFSQRWFLRSVGWNFYLLLKPHIFALKGPMVDWWTSIYSMLKTHQIPPMFGWLKPSFSVFFQPSKPHQKSKQNLPHCLYFKTSKTIKRTSKTLEEYLKKH